MGQRGDAVPGDAPETGPVGTGPTPESGAGSAPGPATTRPGPAPRAGLLTRKTSDFERGLSFFDAIYAFAITLLVVNVDVPPAESWQNLSTLAATGVPRQLGGFVLSFVVIAAFWRINVRLIQGISAMDRATTTANLVAAALVVLVPFTTQGISDPGSSSYALPTAIYAANLGLLSLAQLAMYELARRRGLETTRLSRREHRSRIVNGLVTPAVFLASIPVALVWGAQAGKLFWLAAFVIAPLAGWLMGRAA